MKCIFCNSVRLSSNPPYKRVGVEYLGDGYESTDRIYHCPACIPDGKIYRCYSCKYTLRDTDVIMCRQRMPGNLVEVLPYCASCSPYGERKECKICGTRGTNNTLPRDGSVYCLECTPRHLHCCSECKRFEPLADFFGSDDSICSYCRSSQDEESQISVCNKYHTLHNYSMKLAFPPYLGGRPPFFGIELEVGVKKVHRDLLIANIYELFKCKGQPAELDNVLIKKDSSIVVDNGIEIVSRAATLDWVKKLWTPFFENKPIGIYGWQATSCGMHVHISKVGMSELAICRMRAFLNSANNRNFLEILGGRRLEGYCSSDGSSRITLGSIKRTREGYNGHRNVLNCTNNATIEVRMFKSTLNRRGFFKNVEFCAALREWSVLGIMSLDRLRCYPSYGSFMKWVLVGGKYPNLIQYFLQRFQPTTKTFTYNLEIE